MDKKVHSSIKVIEPFIPNIITLATLEEAFASNSGSGGISKFLEMSKEEKEGYFRRNRKENQEKQTRIRQALSDIRKAYGKRTVIVAPEYIYEGILFNARPYVRVTAAGLIYLDGGCVRRVIYSPEELKLVKKWPVYEFNTDKYRSSETLSFAPITRLILYTKGIKGKTTVRKA